MAVAGCKRCCSTKGFGVRKIELIVSWTSWACERSRSDVVDPLKATIDSPLASTGSQRAQNPLESLMRYRVSPSVSRRGNPYDSAAMESFFATLKTECFQSKIPQDRSPTSPCQTPRRQRRLRYLQLPLFNSAGPQESSQKNKISNYCSTKDSGQDSASLTRRGYKSASKVS